MSKAYPQYLALVAVQALQVVSEAPIKVFPILQERSSVAEIQVSAPDPQAPLQLPESSNFLFIQEVAVAAAEVQVLASYAVQDVQVLVITE